MFSGHSGDVLFLIVGHFQYVVVLQKTCGILTAWIPAPRFHEDLLRGNDQYEYQYTLRIEGGKVMLNSMPAKVTL